ncbi:hypothetical protein [Streptomyces sp. NPDC090053]|uniref:hypothetical protein n=1 Tax=Streptomyces sp. NPDC090053 TaxID=3365932 RepID=UPI003829EC75
MSSRRPRPRHARHGRCFGALARDVFGLYDVIWYASGALCAAALMALVIRQRPVAAVAAG